MALTAGIVGLQTLESQHYLMQYKAGGRKRRTIRFATIDPNVRVVEVPDLRLQN